MSFSRQVRRAAERKARKEARRQMQAQAAGTVAGPVVAPAPAPEPEQSLPDIEPRVDAVAEARAATNRANAQKSTGPRTAEGRAISSQNSLKHGLYSKQLVVPGEDPDELEQLKHDLVAEHQPGTPTEYMLVNEMAEHYWRLQRYRRIETALLADASTPVSLTAAHRFMNTAERGFYKALKTLRDLQKERAERSGARGFVPQESEALPAGPDEVDTSDAASLGFVPQKLQSEAAPSVCSLEPEIFADPNHPGLSRDREGAIRQAAN